MVIDRYPSLPADRVLAAATGVYRRAFAEPPYGEGEEQVGEFVARVLRCADRPGFRLTLCRRDECVVGMALSVHARAGDWWRDRVADALGPAESIRWLEPVIREVIHVATDPGARRCGVGRMLTEDTLDDRDVASVVLSCHPNAPAARALYESCGFQTLLDDFRAAPGQPGFLLMARAVAGSLSGPGSNPGTRPA